MKKFFAKLKSKLDSPKGRRRLFTIAFLAYPTLHFCIFYIAVNIGSLGLAFQKTLPGTNVTYFTFENFARVFREGFAGSDPLLKEGTINALIFFSFSFFILQPLNIIVGYFFYKKIPAYKFFRFVFYLPAVIPATVLATLFKYIISPESSGLLSTLFAQFGWTLPNLLGSSEYAMKTLLVYCAWTGFTGFLLSSNAMKRVPEEIIESAQLDGISAIREVVSILVPLIWPTIATSMLLSVTSIFTATGPILLFTQGNFGTYTVSYWLFERVYTGTNFEYAAAAGIFYTLLGFPLIILTRRLSRKVEDVEY